MQESVLIVDDEQVSRFVLQEALTKRGYAVSQAEDAEEGLRKFKQHPSDLILLDIQLPGISGIDAISKFKGIDPSVVILMITADFKLKRDWLSSLIKRGAYGSLGKPYRMEQTYEPSLVCQVVDSWLQTGLFPSSAPREKLHASCFPDRQGYLPGAQKIIGRRADPSSSFQTRDIIISTRSGRRCLPPGDRVLIWGETGKGKEVDRTSRPS